MKSRPAALLFALVLGVAACTTEAPTASPTIARGGILRVVVLQPGPFAAHHISPGIVSLDAAQPEAGQDAIELLRCCLGRTLMSYVGKPTSAGGADLRADLATGFPEVSADGATWTFHIRPGLHYAPPLHHTEIAAADFVRAIARGTRVFGGNFFPDIVGMSDYQAGKAQSIAGLQTPDAHTLVVRLSAPAGDLGSRMALSLNAPLPPLPNDATARDGVATGHDAGDTGFLVSSGPYMLEGADKVNFSLPPAQQTPAVGLRIGKSITLVRNPSWSASDDPLRPAYVDSIVVTYGVSAADAVAAVDAGRVDIVVDEAHAQQIPLAAVRAYEADPSKGRVSVEPRDGVRFISLNLARPPFDDLHVRRAIAFALDRQAIEDAFGGSVRGAVTGHIALDSMEDNSLISYDPYRSSDAATRQRKARHEMALSPYDSNHDGVCDAAACGHIAALALSDGLTSPQMSDLVRQNLLQIGLTIDVTITPNPDFFDQVQDPMRNPPMALFLAWYKDFLNGSDFFVNLFSSTALPFGDSSLLGATPDQLHGWGYSVQNVASVDDRVNACLPLVGQPQTRCWTTLDEYVTEKVVPVVPFATESYVELVPARIVNYSYDQANNLPALDQIAVTR